MFPTAVHFRQVQDFAAKRQRVSLAECRPVQGDHAQIAACFAIAQWDPVAWFRALRPEDKTEYKNFCEMNRNNEKIIAKTVEMIAPYKLVTDRIVYAFSSPYLHSVMCIYPSRFPTSAFLMVHPRFHSVLLESTTRREYALRSSTVARVRGDM